MPAIALRIILLTSLCWLSWLLMMLVHECGHALAAHFTGGTVTQIVWHPTTISRTDVQPNPRPLAEVWAGPIVGSIIPLAVAAAVQAARSKAAYLIWFFAGFCLIANGAYLAVGAFDPVGDAKQLVALGMPRWLLAVTGGFAISAGFGIWNQISTRLGFGRQPETIDTRHAYVCFFATLLITIIAFAVGNGG